MNATKRAFTDADRRAQTRLADLLLDLEAKLRSKHHTVQVMHDGIEIIRVETGELERKLMLTEVGE